MSRIRKKIFKLRRDEMAKVTDVGHPQQLAAMLIDHGDYDTAEELLSNELGAEDLEARLLIVDARLRTNQTKAARDLLLMIPPDSVTPHLCYPYAVACALVALASSDDDLKRLAIAGLRDLPYIGTKAAEQAKAFLEILQGRKTARQKDAKNKFWRRGVR